MLKRVTTRLGLVRATSLAAVATELRTAQRSAAKRATEIETLRKDNKKLKLRAESAEAALNQAESELAAGRQKFDEVKSELESKLRKVTHELERQLRHAGREIEAETVQRRLREAEREIKTAREYLAVLQSKLDLMEAASRVLDTRTGVLTLRRASIEDAAGAAVEAIERRLR